MVPRHAALRRATKTFVGIAIIVAIISGIVRLGRSEWAIWGAAKRKDTIEAHHKYLTAFPEGQHVAESRARL